MIEIEVRVERRRGCGWRKPGGLYLVADGLWGECEKLPLPLTVCQCCGQGVKPARGWTWIDLQAVTEPVVCGSTACGTCLVNRTRRCGLLWCGEQYYRTPGEFVREALEMGVSRRILHVPKGFKVGETVVAIAHRKAITRLVDGKLEHQAGLIALFIPQRVEYVVRGDESDEFLAGLVERGITPVRVVPQEVQQLELVA